MEGFLMTNKSRVVLITAPIGGDWLERLQNLSPDLRIEQRPARSIETVPDACGKKWKFSSPRLPPPCRCQSRHLGCTGYSYIRLGRIASSIIPLLRPQLFLLQRAASMPSTWLSTFLL